MAPERARADEAERRRSEKRRLAPREEARAQGIATTRGAGDPSASVKT
jgi:hypothetical protein